MSENMDLYNAVRSAPPEALKTIGGGRLKGMTDINPMWRIKILTEQFGPCGLGWKYEIDKMWLEHGANNETAAFVLIRLYVCSHDGWSEPIPGIGGSSFVSKERDGLYTDDECYKKALTDAISVACKALGVAADVYWNSDKTKYTAKEPKKADPEQVRLFYQLGAEKNRSQEIMSEWAKKNMGNVPENLSESQLNRLIQAVKGW